MDHHKWEEFVQRGPIPSEIPIAAVVILHAAGKIALGEYNFPIKRPLILASMKFQVLFGLLTCLQINFKLKGRRRKLRFDLLFVI